MGGKKEKKKIPESWEEAKFAKFSSGSDGSGLEDDEEQDIEDMYHAIEEERDTLFKSDHEFSCESEDEDDKIEVKHARTGTNRKRKRKVDYEEESDEEEAVPFACKKCGHADHPEWILLCDDCEDGWHASCLRPSLMVIPEGDWFCPACNHKSLLSELGSKLEELDVLLKKTEAERRRKERLAFVNKSLSKALPTSSPSKKNEKKKVEISSESETSSIDDSEDELLLPRRCRREVINYNNTEYDDMLKKAIGIEPRAKVAKPVVEEEEEESEEESDDEEEKDSPGKPKSGQGRGKDIGNHSNEGDDNNEKPKPI